MFECSAKKFDEIYKNEVLQCQVSGTDNKLVL